MKDLEGIRKYSRQYEFTIKGTDTDHNDQITLRAITAYIQEAASLDASSLGFGSDTFDESDIIWILIRSSLRFLKKPVWKDKIIVDTWTNGVSGIYALREFAVSSPDGEIYALATSSWILADIDTRRPIKISSLKSRRMEENTCFALEQEAERIRISPAGLQELVFGLPVEVRASDIDRNRHVNNTRYLDWCIDCLQLEEVDTTDIYGFDINYLAEALLGDRLDISYMHMGQRDENFNVKGNSYLIEGRNSQSGKQSFVAYVYYS